MPNHVRTDDGATDAEAPLALLRQEMSGLDTPPDVEQALLAVFAQRHPRGHPSGQGQRWYHRLARSISGARLAQTAGVVAAAALVTVGVFRSAGHVVPAPGGGEFIALESLERIAREPAPRMVEARVPRIVLASLGVPVTAQDADDTVRADLLVDADGHPLALRLTAVN